MSGKEAMRVLARKLRAKAEWDYIDGWYSTDVEMARNAAKREFAEEFAELLDEIFEFDSHITKKDRDTRGQSWERKFTP